MYKKVNICIKIPGMGDFNRKIDYSETFVIEEIRVSAYANSPIYTIPKKYRKGNFTAFIIEPTAPITSSPIYKLNTIKIRAKYRKRLCKRYIKNAKICNSEHLTIKGTHLKYMIYTVTILGYRLIKIR